MTTVACTVMITTHNRCERLRKTLTKLAALDPGPTEIIITADGCNDKTTAMLRRNFPDCRLIENTPGRGSIASRDHMIRVAENNIVLSLDDDSFPLEEDFLNRMMAIFAVSPQLGVLTFPQRSDEFPESLTQIDFGPPCSVASYASSGAALRKSLYLQLPGYAKAFFHAYEEPDYALQCLAAGYDVFRTPDLLIRHYYSPEARNELRTHQQHSRNEAWSVVLQCPLPWVFPVLVFRALRQFGYACSRGPSWMIREPLWWLAFWRGLPTILRHRQPVAWKNYWKWMKMLCR